MTTLVGNNSTGARFSNSDDKFGFGIETPLYPLHVRAKAPADTGVDQILTRIDNSTGAAYLDFIRDGTGNLNLATNGDFIVRVSTNTFKIDSDGSSLIEASDAGGIVLLKDVDLSGFKITGSAEPVDPSDLVTKSYADGLETGGGGLTTVLQKHVAIEPDDENWAASGVTTLAPSVARVITDGAQSTGLTYTFTAPLATRYVFMVELVLGPDYGKADIKVDTVAQKSAIDCFDPSGPGIVKRMVSFEMDLTAATHDLLIINDGTKSASNTTSSYTVGVGQVMILYVDAS